MCRTLHTPDLLVALWNLLLLLGVLAVKDPLNDDANMPYALTYLALFSICTCSRVLTERDYIARRSFQHEANEDVR